MKTFNVLALVALVIAFVGILSQHGNANWISGLSVVPLGLWVLVLLVKAVGGSLNDKAGR